MNITESIVRHIFKILNTDLWEIGFYKNEDKKIQLRIETEVSEHIDDLDSEFIIHSVTSLILNSETYKNMQDNYDKQIANMEQNLKIMATDNRELQKYKNYFDLQFKLQNGKLNE